MSSQKIFAKSNSQNLSAHDKSRRSSILRDNSLRKSLSKKLKKNSTSKLSSMGSSSNGSDLQASSMSLSTRSGSTSTLGSSQTQSSLLKSKTSDLEKILKKPEPQFQSKFNLSFSSQDGGSGCKIIGEYDEEFKNQKFPADCIYGPYPDEVILSGIDRFLHIIGMKSFVGKDFNLKELCAPRTLSLSTTSIETGNAYKGNMKECKCDSTLPKSMTKFNLPKDRDFTLIDVETLINDRLKSLRDTLPKCMCDEDMFKELIKSMLPSSSSKMETTATVTNDVPLDKKKSKHRKKSSKKKGKGEVVAPDSNEDKLISESTSTVPTNTTSTGGSHKSKISSKKLKSKSSIKSSNKPTNDPKSIGFKETVSLNVLPPENDTASLGRCTCSLVECRMQPKTPSPRLSKLYYSARKHSIKKSKPKIVRTQWALTRINIFDDTSRTFEVMRPMVKAPPQTVPEQTEIIFAVLPDGSTVCYDSIQRAKSNQSKL